MFFSRTTCASWAATNATANTANKTTLNLDIFKATRSRSNRKLISFPNCILFIYRSHKWLDEMPKFTLPLNFEAYWSTKIVSNHTKKPQRIAQCDGRFAKVNHSSRDVFFLTLPLLFGQLTVSKSSNTFLFHAFWFRIHFNCFQWNGHQRLPWSSDEQKTAEDIQHFFACITCSVVTFT